MEQPRSSGNREFVSSPSIAEAEDVDEIDRAECLAYIAYLRFGLSGPLVGDDDFLRGGGGRAEDDHVTEKADGGDPEDDEAGLGAHLEEFDGSDFDPSRCPDGHVSTVVRNGRGRRGEQRYLCRECETTFTPLTGTIFEGRKFSLPEMVFLISHMDEMDALSLAERVPRSYRSVRSFLKAVRAAEDSPLVEAFRANGYSTDSDGSASQS